MVDIAMDIVTRKKILETPFHASHGKGVVLEVGTELGYAGCYDDLQAWQPLNSGEYGEFSDYWFWYCMNLEDIDAPTTGNLDSYGVWNQPGSTDPYDEASVGFQFYMYDSTAIPLDAVIDSVVFTPWYCNHERYMDGVLTEVSIVLEVYPIDWVEDNYLWDGGNWGAKWGWYPFARNFRSGAQFSAMDRLAYATLVPTGKTEEVSWKWIWLPIEFTSEPAFSEFIRKGEWTKFVVVAQAWVVADPIDVFTDLTLPEINVVGRNGEEYEAATLEVTWH